MKIVVDSDTREILGAAILGVSGDEAIHSILDLMYAKAPYAVIQRAVHTFTPPFASSSPRCSGSSSLSRVKPARARPILRTWPNGFRRTVANPEAIHMSEKSPSRGSACSGRITRYTDNTRADSR